MVKLLKVSYSAVCDCRVKSTGRAAGWLICHFPYFYRIQIEHSFDNGHRELY